MSEHISNTELIRLAFEARRNAYAPYSHFKVGAALLAGNGAVYKGCNIENSSYGATNCAERTAIFKAISEGVREFDRIAIVGGMEEDDNATKGYAYPCGVCRQVMREFCNPNDFKVIVAKNEEDYIEYTLEEILPLSFGPENIY